MSTVDRQGPAIGDDEAALADGAWLAAAAAVGVPPSADGMAPSDGL